MKTRDQLTRPRPRRNLRLLRLVYVPLISGMVALLTLAFIVPQPDLFETLARYRER